jgi:hypothetical protein
LNVHRKLSRKAPFKNPLRFPTTERPNHNK